MHQINEDQESKTAILKTQDGDIVWQMDIAILSSCQGYLLSKFPMLNFPNVCILLCIASICCVVAILFIHLLVTCWV